MFPSVREFFIFKMLKSKQIVELTISISFKHPWTVDMLVLNDI